MIEAELKARVREPEAVRAALDQRARGQEATYRDVYYDRPDRSLSTAGYEFRLRTIETATGRRHVLTYKRPAVDARSQSKPEHETDVGDPDVVALMLAALGLSELVALTKRCVNYAFSAMGRPMLATLVTVPELDGAFLEVETRSGESDLQGALAALRSTLAHLGISDEDLTSDTYTGAVMRARRF